MTPSGAVDQSSVSRLNTTVFLANGLVDIKDSVAFPWYRKEKKEKNKMV